MSRKINFLWIDDDSRREKTSDYFDDDNLIACQFEYVSEKDLIQFLFNDVFLREEPDLLKSSFLDHLMLK